MQKFHTLCSASGYAPITRLAGTTLWLYLPLQEPLMDIKADQAHSTPTQTAGDAKMSLVYWDVTFEDREFVVKYDDEMRRSYPSNISYKTAYTESFQQKQQSIMNSLLQSFHDSDGRPEFVIFVVSDITRGMVIKTIFNFDDMRKASSMPPAISTDEYAKRFISEVNGDLAAINDTKGKHLSWEPLTWAEFLRRQMKHRISFKFQQSSFPPSENVAQELGRICRDTVKAYDFKDYDAIIMEDIATGELFKLQ